MGRPHAFPDQRIEDTLPLEHDGLDLEEIRKQQESEFVKERQLADSEDSQYTLINNVLYSIKRPQQTAPDYPRLVLLAAYRDKVIDRAHKEVGHLAHATLIRLTEAYVWPGMRASVRRRLKRCPTCQVHSTHRDRVEMGEHELPHSPTVGPFVQSPQGNRYLLTILDHSTLWAEAYPIPDKTNKSVWNAFANQFIPRFGLPCVLLSDNGSEFTAHA